MNVFQCIQRSVFVFVCGIFALNYINCIQQQSKEKGTQMKEMNIAGQVKFLLKLPIDNLVTAKNHFPDLAQWGAVMFMGLCNINFIFINIFFIYQNFI